MLIEDGVLTVTDAAALESTLGQGIQFLSGLLQLTTGKNLVAEGQGIRHVVPTDEERMISLHTLACVGGAGG